MAKYRYDRLRIQEEIARRRPPPAPAYPAPPSSLAYPQYLPLFDRVVLIPRQAAVDQIHVDERDCFVREIAQAQAYRIPVRLGLLKFPDPPRPERFPDAPTLIDLKPSVEALPWWKLVLSSTYEAQKKEAADVSTFNRQAAVTNREVQDAFLQAKQAFDAGCRARRQEYETAATSWRTDHERDSVRFRALRQEYEDGTPEGLCAYVKAALDAAPLPAWCPRDYVVRFDPPSSTTLIETRIPYMHAFEIVKTRNGKVVPATKPEASALRHWFSYMLPLRLMWEVAQVDDQGHIERVASNVQVEFDDPATGRRRKDTIMSVAAPAAHLREMQLEKVDPETCFKSLKGIAAANILELVPVRPLISFDKNDSRFVDARPVLDGLGETNLATMDWQDFEHLVRELLEKEFGTDVRITQASRDKGVDAVAFDPDPIRGGKFVIQAKRYTNTVDVSAVRDLYGTLMNEGANRGILVATSNYGRDAYEFAADKPITLLNGAHLLHLLEKHGYRCRIDFE